MSSFLISYDLCEPGQNYEKLIDAIKDYGTYAKINKSSWIVTSDISSIDIRNKLKSCLDSNDKLFVAKLTGQAAWTKCDCSDQWLKSHL